MSSKKIKKTISHLWKEVMQDVADTKVPSRSTVAKLLKNCEDFNLYAERSWAVQWRQCCDQVKQCVSAAQMGDFDSAREKLIAIKQLEKECHTKYK